MATSRHLLMLILLACSPGVILGALWRPRSYRSKPVIKSKPPFTASVPTSNFFPAPDTVYQTVWATEITVVTYTLPPRYVSSFITLPQGDYLPPKAGAHSSSSVSLEASLDLSSSSAGESEFQVLNELPQNAIPQAAASAYCNKWIHVTEGMTCNKIEKAIGVKVKDIMRWNNVGEDCRALWFDGHVSASGCGLEDDN